MNDDSAATIGHEAPTVAATTPTTVEQAAAILGVSITTVKRRIRAGLLRAEQAQRPQGIVWLVHLPTAATPAADERPPAASGVATAATTPTAQAEALTGLVQATVATVLGPLVAELAASRQTNERQAERIAVLERENGHKSAEIEAAAGEQIAAKVRENRLRLELERETARLTAERDAVVAAQAQQEARTAVEPAPAPVESPTPLWRGRWSVVLAIVAVVLLLFVLVLAWPR